MKDNKKTITKKLLAFTLAFILLMTSLPLNVFAEMENESNSNFIEENAGEVKNPVGIGKNSKEENFEEIEATDLDVDSIKGEKAKESPYQAAKNPDNLVGNEIPDGTINYGPFEETKIFKVSGNMIRNAENRESSAPQWVQNLINPGGTLDPDLVNEGSVKAYKPVVEEDPNIANKWTVKMLVAARDSVKTSKIVLVIDTSGSMKDFGRMKGAKNAANAFVDNVLDGSQSTQIGIVRFASNVSIVSDFTSNKAKLHSAINALSAEGGTFTQAGVKQARTMLAGSGADKKYMVVLSDGVPTFNYKISHPNNYLIDGGPGSHTHEKQTGKQLPENEFLYNESATGSGNSMWKQYERVKIGGGIFPTYEYHYYNSGNCAIAESGFAKAANMRVFTVGLQTDATGSGVLRDIASAPGDFTEVTDVSQLTPVFEQIAAQILKTVNQATVNVNFNTGFQLPDDFDPATAGHSPGSEITVVDGKPKWTMATVATVFDENDPSLKYEYITYTVTINDAILKNNSPENGINPLGQISMTYTDQNGNPQTTDFPETQVTPKLFVLNKVVTNNAGGAAVDSDKREFQFKVEKVVGSGYTYHETIGLRPGEQKIIHNPDKNADYRVYELRTAKVYDENNENPLNFNVTTYYNKFEVTANGDLPTTTGDAPAGDGIGKSITGSILGGTAGKRLNVTFKNWEEEEARAKISIHKIVEQSRGISRQTPPTFTINLKRKAGVVPGMENEHNWDQTVGMNQTVTIPHMMRFTTYIVTEKDLASILPYAPKLGEQGKEVEITLYKVTAGGALGQVIDFTNVYNSSATVNVTATKTWENGPDADHTAPVFELYADGNKVEGVTPTIVPSSGTATSFTYTWTVQAINATTHLPIEYTVKEAGVGADNKITVNNHIYTVSQHGNEITNTYEIPNNGTFTATKVWSGDEKVTRPTMNFELWRRIGNAAGEQVPGAEVKEINGSITTATWTGLETTTAAGDEYTFYVKESLKNPGDVNNDNWILGEFNTQNNSITNTVKTGDENLGKLTVAKKLLETGNGVRALRGTPIKFSFKVTGPANYEETFELAPGESKVLTGLYFGEYKVEETNTQGYTATYSVADGKVTLKATEKEKTVEVINTSGGQGTVVEKTLEKVWVNGPKPTVTIELWRKNNVEGADKIDEKVDEFIVPANANGNDLKKTFTNLAKHDPKGNEFEYYAKEENVPANYTKAIDGLKVTNTYNQPSNGEVTVTKEWQDPDGKTLVKPEVNLTLYRKIEGGAEEQVPVAEAEVKVVNGTTTTAKWENLKTTDINGNAYSFIVKESFKNAGDVNNDNWTLITSTDVVNGAATIKNEALVSEADLGKLTVTKKPLVNGQGVRGPVGQRGTPLKFSFKVTGPAGYEESFELAATESKELKGLYFGEYKVEETDSKGYTATYSVTDGKVTLKAADKEKTVEVTNTSGGQGTVVEKTLEKVWVNGPKPTVTIELWRKNNVESADKIDEKVDEFIVPANASGNDLKKTFTNLAKHDPKGNEFEYYAKEENVPVNYTKSENGLVVTNTYTQLSNGEVTVTKVWKDPDGKTLVKPEVNLTLYRKIEGGAEEQVPVAEAEVKVVSGTTTTAKWENLKTTDINGNAYSFIVKESFKNADDVNNDNWTLVASTDVVNGAATITNKAVTGEENLGKLTVAKKLLETGNGVRGLRGTPIKFSFKVTGPANYEETFELAPGESKVLTGLYFGEYTVTETDTKGYTATYSVADGKVTLKAADKEKTVEVTNTSGGQGTVVEKTLEKVWVNGPKPTVTIELWRKNNVEGADKIDEKVDEFIVPANASGNDLKKTFTNLAKHDPKGNEFEYYAKEENVPANYKKSIEGLKVTNTYVSPIVPPTILKGDVTANKIWRDYKAIHPTIWFKLYRNIVGGNLEEVPNAEIKELKEGTTKVTWTKQNLEDKKGNKYIFSVKEVDSNGRDYVPYGYEKSEVGLTVINSKKEKDSSNVIVTPAPKLNKKDHFPYVMGYPDGSFKPEGNITRAEMTAIFSRLLTEKMHVGDNYPLSFSDVARSSWYAEYIGQLTSVGVIAGYPDGTFRPENSVTRAEFATVASRFITSKKSTGGFADILNNHWAKESIENVRAEGWISGYSDGSFKPDQYITRAEVVSIVNKMLDRYADKNYVDSHAMELTNYTDLSKNHWAYYPIMEASNGHDYERLSNNQEVWKTSWKPRKY